MRTTLDVDPQTLNRVLAETGETSKSRAVQKVLEDYVRRIRQEKLKSMAGRLDLDDSWKVWRSTEPGEFRTIDADKYSDDD